jgi:hypothetical protein
VCRVTESENSSFSNGHHTRDFTAKALTVHLPYIPSSVLTSSSLSSCDRMEGAWALTSFSWTCMVLNAPYKHIRATAWCRCIGRRSSRFVYWKYYTKVGVRQFRGPAAPGLERAAQDQSALTSGLPEPTLVAVGETTVISDNSLRLIALRPLQCSDMPS